MIKSKEWNWAEVRDDFWSTPSEDVYYYASRWKEKGFKYFLDLGCGLGRHSVFFAENGFETYSLDLSEDGINNLNRKAEKLGLNIRTTIGDINNLPYSSDMFDCLLAYHVISHTDTEGIKAIVKELERVLKSGGEFFITLCSKCSPSFSRKDYIRIDENTIIKTEEPEIDVPHFYTDLDGVRSILKNFDIIRIRHIEDIFNDSNSWHYFVHGKKK
ncbi:MAG: class I SAM-dependent methyltransferase [Caulobacteraceae bacterium]